MGAPARGGQWGTPRPFLPWAWDYSDALTDAAEMIQSGWRDIGQITVRPLTEDTVGVFLKLVG